MNEPPAQLFPPPYEDDGVSQCYVKELVPH